MTCDQVRPLLPLAAYGDLSGAEEEAVRGHLADCSACRAEGEAIQRLRTNLDAVPPPEVSVSVAAILRAESADQARRVRRWRRVAIAAGALAASVLTVLVVRPDIRIDDGALVVRWREPSTQSPQAVVRVEQPARDDQRVDLLVKLVRAMAEDAEGRDRDRRGEITAIKARVDRLALQEDARWQDVQKDVGVLYRAQFARREGGE
jgi:anti-sigma factor RsiW